MLALSPAQRRELRARAHPLHPVVAIGHAGLTPSVLHEIDVALRAHELVKVRVHSDDRDQRERLLAEVCEGLDAGPVQHLGKLLILWRPKPAPAREDRERPGARPAKPTAKRRGERPAAKGAQARRGPPDPKIGPRARKHRRGAARHDPGTPGSGKPLATRRRTARAPAPDPAVPTTSAPRGGRYVDGKPAIRDPRGRRKPSSGKAAAGAPATVRRRRRPAGKS